MELSGPSRKRQRTEDDDVIVKPEPSDEVGPTATLLNYEDGNVVIRCYTRLSIAELSTYYREGRIAADSVDAAIKAISADGMFGCVQYRVHRGILASHSTVFADYFGGKESTLTGHDRRHDGDIIFEFTGYNTQDLELCRDMDAFLAMIYSPDYLNERATKLNKVATHQLLSLMLRATKRFGSTSIRTICVGHLERLYPTKLSYWTPERLSEAHFPATTFALRFSTEHSIGSIIPILLYRLSTLLAPFDGFEHPEYHEDLDKIMSSLTAQDLQYLLRGNTTLTSQCGVRFARLAALDKFDVCQQPKGLHPIVSCFAIFAGHVRPPFASPESPPSVYYARDPLGRFDEIASIVAKEALMCTNCKTAYVRETRGS